MILTSSIFVTLVAQQVQLKSIRIFPGGTFEQYVRFVAVSDCFPKRVNIVPEKFFAGMGPVRVLRYSDNTVKLDPPLPTYLKYREKGAHRFLQAGILPEPFFRANYTQSKYPALDDNIKKLQLEMTPNQAPGIDASFRLGNGLNGLGYHTNIHPFFKDMWVNVQFSGNWQPDLLDAIAGCVGATIVKKGDAPTTYSFEPNVEDIRSRALSTLEFFTPTNASEPIQLRQKAHYELIKNCSSAFMKRWIDAAIKPDQMPLPGDPWTKPLREYCTARLSSILNQKEKGPLNKWTMDDFGAMPISIRLNPNLEFALMLQPSDDLPIWL